MNFSINNCKKRVDLDNAKSYDQMKPSCYIILQEETYKEYQIDQKEKAVVIVPYYMLEIDQDLRWRRQVVEERLWQSRCHH